MVDWIDDDAFLPTTKTISSLNLNFDKDNDFSKSPINQVVVGLFYHLVIFSLKITMN